MANYFSCLRFVSSWFCNWPGPAQLPTHNRELPTVKLDTTEMGTKFCNNYNKLLSISIIQQYY